MNRHNIFQSQPKTENPPVDWRRTAMARISPHLFLLGGNFLSATLFSILDENSVFLLWMPLAMAIMAGIHLNARCAGGVIACSICMHAVAGYCSQYWRENTMLSSGILLSAGITGILILWLSKHRNALEKKVNDWEVASKTDALTGTLNRRGFLDCIATLFDHARTKNKPAALLFIDLDDFKLVNDRLGHHQGDRVLRSVAQVLQASIRSTDSVYRIGGDEFTVLLPHLDNPGRSTEVAQRILDGIRNIVVDPAHAIRIGASIGICIFPNATISDATSALSLADQMMYKAKNAGKNKIFSFGEPATEMPRK